MSKRIEAWAVVGDIGLVELLYDPKTAERAARDDRAYGIRDARAVRLVPHSPAEARLVRAAMKWATQDLAGISLGSGLSDVLRAAEAVERERRRKR